MGLHWGSRLLVLVAGLTALAVLGLLAPAAARRVAGSCRLTQSAAAAAAGTVPSGFTESVAISGLDHPTSCASLRTAASSSRRRAGASRSTTTWRTRRRRSSPTLRQRSRLLGSRHARYRARSRLPQPARTSTCSTRTTTSSAEPPAPRWGRPVPDAPRAHHRRMRRQRATLALAGRRQRDDRHGAGAHRGLVPAVPSHSIGSSSSAPTARSTRAAATARASGSPTTARTANPQNPCGDPRWRRRPRHRPAPKAARCAPRTCARDRPDRARRIDDPRRPGDRRRHCRQPAGRQLRSERPPHRRLRPPQPVPLRVPPGTKELWVGDVGWNDWEEIDRIADPADSTVENFGWPCYEGTNRSPATTRPTSTSARTCTPRRARTRAVLHVPPREQVVAGESCPTGQLVDPGMAFESHRGEHVPGRVSRRAVLRRLLARLHLGDEEERRTPTRRPEIRRSSAGAANPVEPRVRARTATSSTSTSTAETSIACALRHRRCDLP